MNCFYHPSEPAVTKCQDCEKYLCHACATKYTTPICDSCYQKRLNRERMSYIKAIVICIILFIVAFNIEDDPRYQLLAGYLAMSAYAGWMYANKIIDFIVKTFWPKSTLWVSLPIFLVCIYYVFKLYIAVHIGVFVTPFYLFNCGRKLLKRS